MHPMSVRQQTRTAAALQILRPAVLVTLLLVVACGVVYPLVTTAVAQLFFRDQANGSLIRDANGQVIGSALIAQSFTRQEYFHPRPSAAGTDGYDAASSGASNLGPTNPTLLVQVNDLAAAYRQENGMADNAPVPPDAITSSASGLDPDISPANAALQIRRVAAARGLPEDQVRGLVNQYTQGRTFGILGEPRVNVLQLNLALDAAQTH
jgi:potassium-transporting ATPase KdpC subunit